MITLDTNIMVRILVDDIEQPVQTQKARALVVNEKQVYVPQIVQVECIWVLQRVYKLNKAEIISVLEHLSQNPAFVLQHSDIFSNAIEFYRCYKVGFSDCLILAESLYQETTLYTFDKKLAQAEHVKEVI